MEIRAGETVSITGPSGLVKSDFRMYWPGIERMDQGEVWIKETAVHKLDEDNLSQLRLNKMGFIFQSYHLVPVLRAWENAALPLIAKGMNRKEAYEKAVETLKLVGLAERERYPSELSGGQNQRVAIARAIIGKPDIIWADEPTGALDSETADQIIGLLEMLNRHYGTTLVIVTHDSHIADRMNRTIRMQNGRIIHDGGVSL